MSDSNDQHIEDFDMNAHLTVRSDDCTTSFFNPYEEPQPPPDPWRRTNREIYLEEQEGSLPSYGGFIYTGESWDYYPQQWNPDGGYISVPLDYAPRDPAFRASPVEPLSFRDTLLAMREEAMAELTPPGSPQEVPSAGQDVPPPVVDPRAAPPSGAPSGLEPILRQGRLLRRNPFSAANLAVNPRRTATAGSIVDHDDVESDSTISSAPEEESKEEREDEEKGEYDEEDEEDDKWTDEAKIKLYQLMKVNHQSMTKNVAKFPGETEQSLRAAWAKYADEAKRLWDESKAELGRAKTKRGAVKAKQGGARRRIRKKAD
ncbi:hypothetical protein IQ07DRAFT_597316 [Pyrenochaeta sp. DS3sAY3a]|nr:hypothetical protein IQ07DRAFT_597316 [Pyrenochaeta sp. DS3sAY3a]